MTFVFDSGAISRMRFSKDGLVNLKPLKIAIQVGNAEDICNIPWLSMHGLLWDLPGTVQIVLSFLSSVQ
jgi:hypothetical protein